MMEVAAKSCKVLRSIILALPRTICKPEADRRQLGEAFPSAMVLLNTEGGILRL